MGVKIALQSRRYTRLLRQGHFFSPCLRRVTPEVTGLPSLLLLNRQRIIKSIVEIRVSVHPMSVF